MTNLFHSVDKPCSSLQTNFVCPLAGGRPCSAASPPGVLLLPIMLTQDEATFDGNFRRTLTPIYATLACIRAGGGLQHCHAHKINIVML